MISLSLTHSVLAESVRVKGPPERGHARPPLFVNVTPASSVYYSPGQIRHAYGFDQLSATGAGQKIAIVDAYGNPSIQSDLNAFCSQFGLASTTVQVLGNNVGGDSGWAMETALDVEWAHAIAPGATILLAVAPSSRVDALLNAVDAAVNAGATVVSMSWGAPEFFGMSSYDGHFNRANVAFTASSGDGGAGVEWPAVSPYVLGVGGTSLHLDANNNRASETAWSGSGGGASSSYAIPSYQSGWQTTGARGVPDVSYLADPNTGVLVYDSVNGGWLVVGGTSAGAPQWAGLIGLANELRVRNGSSPLGVVNRSIYPLAQGNATVPYTVNAAYFYDVSQGNDGLYSAVGGYDLVTGLGSPLARALATALAGSAQPSPVTADFSANPTSGQAPLTVQFTDRSTGPMASWSWTFGDGASSTAQNPSHTYNSAGNFTATLTVTGTNSQTSSASHTITVTNPPAGSADFSIFASPPSTVVKAGQNGYYTVNVTPTGGFSGAVILNVTGLPLGAIPIFNPPWINGSGNSTLTILTSPFSPHADATLTITGMAIAPTGLLTHSVNVTLKIR